MHMGNNALLSSLLISNRINNAIVEFQESIQEIVCK